MAPALLAAALVLLALGLAPAADPSPIPASARQLVLVTTADWAATGGTLRRFSRTASGWEPVGEPARVVVGRGGLGWGRGLHGGPRADGPAKAEGDGRAPAGAFRLSAAFGYAEAEPTGLPYVQSTPGLVCVDDSASASYNLVREGGAAADWRSREDMRRPDELYRIGVVVAHNGPGVDGGLVGAAPREAAAPVAGGGSCIFLHVWRGPESTTAGCTAMADGALQRVLAWLRADADPVLVQLPAAEAERLRGAWGLPE